MSPAATKGRAGSKAPAGAGKASEAVPDAARRQEYMATFAYYKAEARGFTPGRELDDWLEAEAKYTAALGKKS